MCSVEVKTWIYQARYSDIRYINTQGRYYITRLMYHDIDILLHL